MQTLEHVQNTSDPLSDDSPLLAILQSSPMNLKDEELLLHLKQLRDLSTSQMEVKKTLAEETNSKVKKKTTKDPKALALALINELGI